MTTVVAEDKMKKLGMILGALLAASVAGAQQTSTVQMQCHTLSSGNNFLQSNETVVNGMACHTVTSPAASTSATAPTPAKVEMASAAPVSTAPVIAPAPNTVFIEPMNGFESYLAAAFEKKQVPLTIVSDEAHAVYVIKGTAEEKKAGWAKIVLAGDIHSDDAASIQMIDRKTDAVVFAYAVNKKSTWHGNQTTAEACAKHLKEQIEKGRVR